MTRLVLVAVAAGLAWSALLVAFDFEDSYQAWRIEREMELWNGAGGIPEDRRLALNIETVESLLARDPGDPRLHFLAASLYQWRGFLQRYNRRSASESREMARRHLEDAISLRPLWGKAWGAWVNNAGHGDTQWQGELAYRFDTALRLGRHDLDTQRQLAPFIAREWDGLPEDVRQLGGELFVDWFYRAGLARSYIDDVLALYRDHPLRQILRGARPEA